jgi:hypothetical protein
LPQYFFHIRDGDALIRDEEGSLFADIEGACSKARLSARDLALELLRSGNNIEVQAIELTNEAGTALMSVPLPLILTERAPGTYPTALR